MHVLQVYYLEVYQSLTNFYLNITSFSKNIKFVTLSKMTKKLQRMTPNPTPILPILILPQIVAKIGAENPKNYPLFMVGL